MRIQGQNQLSTSQPTVPYASFTIINLFNFLKPLESRYNYYFRFTSKETDPEDL